jgi:hypothetical protein
VALSRLLFALGALLVAAGPPALFALHDHTADRVTLRDLWFALLPIAGALLAYVAGLLRPIAAQPSARPARGPEGDGRPSASAPEGAP